MVQKKRIEFIFELLKDGCEYQEKYNNLYKACEYFDRAKKLIGEIYGADSKICRIVYLFDHIQEEYKGDYRASVLKIADAAEMLEKFEKRDIEDEFTEWIYESKEEMLEEAAIRTLKNFEYLGADFSIEKLFKNILLSRNNEEELINRTFCEPLGLPQRFHYLIGRFGQNTSVSPDALYDIAEIHDNMEKLMNANIDDLDVDGIKDYVNNLLDLITKNKNLYKKFGISDGMSRFLGNREKNIYYDVARGLAGLGEPEYLELFLNKIKEEDIGSTDEKIKIMLAECWLKNENGEKEEAEKILDEIIKIVLHTIMQVYFMKDEKQKIEFLNTLSYITKRFIDICYKVQGTEGAYLAVCQTRNLSYDHSAAQLDTDNHRKLAIRMMELEQEEKRGINNRNEKDFLMKQMQGISGGIQPVETIEICRRLTNRQAVLEFTIMTDIFDKDIYYVFVITAKGIQTVKLGDCQSLDILLDDVLDYIKDYSASRHSSTKIKELRAYYDIFQQVVTVIGEYIPQCINSLFIAAAGKFNRIPFGMLPGFRWYDGFLEDECRISYINGGKELLRDCNIVKNRTALVIGAPDFGGKYLALPSSEREVKAVAEILKTNPITGSQAEAKCLTKPAGIIHISTHSYEDQEGTGQSGLVFAGGEKLSVQKISQMNLSETNLVVLSACGVKEGEGVYSDIGSGIRRAFINAGARHIILNLWKTDDYAAEIFMKYFYDKYIVNGLELKEALREAKYFIRTSSAGVLRNSSYLDKNIDSIVKSMKENEIPYEHPYYWAGFIVVGV